MLNEQRTCFLDPVTAAGTPDPTDPVTAGLTCIGTSTSGAANSLLGLPGPGRFFTERTVTLQ
jgi:hypothetical protein